MSMDSKQSPSSPPVRALGEHFETALDRAARGAEPPDYDQLAAYVDGALDDVDREIVESWLDSDPALRAEVEDLRALHDAMSQTAVPAASSAAGVVSFQEAAKRAGAGSGRRFGTVAVIMGAMAAALIGAVTWMAVRTARVGDVRPGAAGSQARVAPEQTQRQAPPRQSPLPQSQGSGTPQVAVRDAGGLISVDATGTVTGLTAAAATPQMTRLVADALAKGVVPRADTPDLGGRPLTLMGGSGQPSPTRLTPLSPIATVVRGARPVFRWSSHPGARNYVVTIYGPDFERVLASPTVTGTVWTATSALTPGVTYQWQVTADTAEGPVRAPAPPAPDARFRIIDAAAGETLDRDLTLAGSSQLQKGLLLAQAGVLDEAEEAFEALQAENPDSKRVADLLARVRVRRLAP
jgi:hypothetical protein